MNDCFPRSTVGFASFPYVLILIRSTGLVTKLSLAIRILAIMMGKSKTDIGTVHVEQEGHIVPQDGFIFSRYRGMYLLETCLTYVM